MGGKSSILEIQNVPPEQRLFPVFYSTARSMIERLGDKINIKMSPHDLRRHWATYASRNRIPPDVISEIILRHQGLKTTQMYLGRISEAETLRSMDVLQESKQNRVGASSAWLQHYAWHSIRILKHRKAPLVGGSRYVYLASKRNSPFPLPMASFGRQSLFCDQ
jgi:hypothetical protein